MSIKITQHVSFFLDLANISLIDLTLLRDDINEELERREDKNPRLRPEERAMARGNKIAAIRMYRNRTGASLKECLKVVDNFLFDHPLEER